MIEVEHFSKCYGDFIAVNDLSFTVGPGEVLGLVGPNGAGKTSTLRSISGIIPATEGRIRIAGHDINDDEVAAKHALAFFPDEPRLYEYLTVRQHLTFIATVYNVAGHEEKIAALLDEMELTDKANKYPSELSRGMKQKLVIACGLLHDPRAMFFDEPLTGLDPLAIRRMKNSILQRADAGAAIILSSHLINLVEEICSHLLILKNGRQVALGTLDAVRRAFAGDADSAGLEEIFIRATDDPGDR